METVKMNLEKNGFEVVMVENAKAAKIEVINTETVVPTDTITVLTKYVSNGAYSKAVV